MNISPLIHIQKKPWFDMRLSEGCMQQLHKAISKENKKNVSKKLAGNISKSEDIVDKDNWFYKMILKKLTERMFYRDWDNFSKYHIEVEEGIPLPEFELTSLWVNYQKQHEFNPLHNHSGGNGYSFVIFVKIPTHWKEQHALPFSANSNTPRASDFVFVMGEGMRGEVNDICIPLCPEDEGRMLFFPAWLKHLVYPFYECEEERITISGNIIQKVQYRTKELEISGEEYEEKEKLLEISENNVKLIKEELLQMKKEREKEE